MPPVSIIATVLNEAEDIGRLVNSLFRQDPAPAEIIIVDGGSTDGTWQWLEDAARTHANLLPIRDESCNLKNCPGPVSRGRNVAIAAAKSEIIACVDAGCTYAPDWIERIAAPLMDGSAQYVLGGSCLDAVDPTVWDIASSHFLGVRISESTPSKSCTARSMAFTKDLWRRVGGFPETVLLGEDTLFDLEARRLTQPVFVEGAKAIYRPHNTLLSASRQLARYATSDGILGVRRARLFRNAMRCLLQLLAVLCLPWTNLPLVAVLLLQCWLAYGPDGRFVLKAGPGAILARFLFSVIVPWVVSINHVRGILNKKNPNNRQNQHSAA